MGRYNTRRNGSDRNSIFGKNYIERITNQFIICAGVALVIIVISNFNNPFFDKVMNGIKWTLSTNYDFQEQYVNIKDNIIPALSSKFKEISDGGESIFSANGNDELKDVAVNSTLSMIMPVEGQITSVFGERDNPITKEKEQHEGIDIAGIKGTPIKVVLDGVVEKVEEDTTLGRSVTVKHDNGVITSYSHCSEILANENQTVKQGEIIAKVGDTGQTTGPHLHFMVYIDGEPVNPGGLLGVISE